MKPIDLSEWEWREMMMFVESRALTYHSHFAMHGLKPGEVERMKQWDALAQKLKEARL